MILVALDPILSLLMNRMNWLKTFQKQVLHARAIPMVQLQLSSREALHHIHNIWDDPNMQTTPIATGLVEGPIYVTVTDANGCDVIGLLTVGAQNDLPSVVITANGDTNCFDSFITLDAGSGMTSYSWSTGAITQDITVDASGTYVVTVTNNKGCQNLDSITVVKGPCVGLDEKLGRATIRYYPNPTKGEMQIVLTDHQETEGQLTVFNLQGQVVLKQWLIKVAGTNSYEFTLAGQSLGIYLV